MASKLPLWILLACFFKYTHQACSSTVAITTCTWDTIKPNKPLHINDYRTYLSFSRGNLDAVPSSTFKYLPQVTTLQLSYNKIKNLEEDAFLGLQDLKELNLYDNQLKVIEKDIFKYCPKLEKLDLGMNKISNIHEKAFENLARLRQLNLAFNSLKAVPVAINHAPKLEIFSLSNNAIDILKSNVFSDLNKLQQLFVNDNKIATIEKHAFAGLVSLKQLDLGANYLTELDVEDLVNDAAALKSVRLSINDFKCSKLTDIVNQFKRYRIEVPQGGSRSSNTVNGIGCKK